MSAKPVGTTPTVQKPTTQKPATQPPVANQTLRIQTPTQPATGAASTQPKEITIGQNGNGDLQITVQTSNPQTGASIPSFAIGANPSAKINETQNAIDPDKKLDITI